MSRAGPRSAGDRTGAGTEGDEGGRAPSVPPVLENSGPPLGVERQPGFREYRFGPPAKSGMGRGVKGLLIVLAVGAIVGAGLLVAVVAGGREASKGFGEAFSGQPCQFLSDQEVQGEFGSAVARDLDSLPGRGFERSQDRRVVLDRPETCVVTFDKKPATLSGSPSAIVTMTEQVDASQVFDRTRQHAQNGGFLAEDAVDVGDVAFCTSPGKGGIGGVLARAGNRLTYVIIDGADSGVTSGTEIPDGAESCREAARVARLVLD